MLKKMALAATAGMALAATPAQAATLVGVTVQGTVLGGGTTTGTVWDTVSNGFYAVFVARPLNNILNPTDVFPGAAVTTGVNNFAIFGEGWVPGQNVNSDIEYRITLNFSNGAVLTGNYSFGPGNEGGVFTGGTSQTIGGLNLALTGFAWDRGSADIVTANAVGEGGDPNDYTGLFRFTSTAVPEPTTWALFILGFGAIGGAMRRRSGKVRVAKASLNFA